MTVGVGSSCDLCWTGPPYWCTKLEKKKEVRRADMKPLRLEPEMHQQYSGQISDILLPGLMYSSISTSSFSLYTSSSSGSSYTSLLGTRPHPLGLAREFFIISSLYFPHSQRTSSNASTPSLFGTALLQGYTPRQPSRLQTFQICNNVPFNTPSA